MSRIHLCSLLTMLLLISAPALAQTQTKPEPKPTPTTGVGNVITDGWLTLKIHAQFIPDKTLENSDIDVDTKAGIVTLTGTVPTQAAKDRAAAIAKMTDGVKSVKDDLRVAPATAGAAMTDGWVKSKIASQFVMEKGLDNSDIDIDVTKGAVTLTGAVPSEAARTRAESIAKVTEGVTSVKNNLKVSTAK